MRETLGEPALCGKRRTDPNAARKRALAEMTKTRLLTRPAFEILVANSGCSGPRILDNLSSGAGLGVAHRLLCCRVTGDVECG